MLMTPEQKQEFINENIKALKTEIWKLDTLAAAFEKAGAKDTAKANIEKSAELTRVLEALKATPID